MTLKKRIKFIVRHINSIGVLTTFSYFFQRVVLKKGLLIRLRIKGLSFPVFLRNKSYDTNVFYQIFICNEFDINFNNEIKIILDLGANIGLSALYFTRKFPSAKIISLEPETNNFFVLKRNTSGYNNIQSIQAGVYSKDCNLSVVDVGEGEASYRIVEDPSTHKILETIECLRIDTIMQQFNLKTIDILKMDIEGSEEACIGEINKKWLYCVKYFMLEIHETIKSGLTSKIISAIPSSYNISHHGEYTIFYNNEYSIMNEQ